MLKKYCKEKWRLSYVSACSEPGSTHGDNLERVSAWCTLCISLCRDMMAALKWIVCYLLYCREKSETFPVLIKTLFRYGAALDCKYTTDPAIRDECGRELIVTWTRSNLIGFGFKDKCIFSCFIHYSRVVVDDVSINVWWISAFL